MKSTREQALRIAQRLGCYGAHEASDGSWLPCKDEETFIAVSRGEKIPAVKQEKSSVLEYRNAKTASISKSLYPTREEALAASKRNGCSGVRVVRINGGTMYAACMPKNNGRPENTGMIKPSKDDWEPLNEGPIASIDTLPDGSLVSGKNLGPTIAAQSASSSGQQRDGDGDGYVSSTPGGPDDTRVSPKNTNKPQKNQKKPPKGQIAKGNINLNNRPVVKNRDGSISTVRSISMTEGRVTVLIPTVIRNPDGTGKIVSNREAWRHYQRTGEHLGKFSSIEDADVYAENLHNDQAAQYLPKRKSLETAEIIPIDAKGFVNYVSRSTDPDVFMNPDSARVRARQLGCIGIRSYTASDGKTVYLPCTATPDYNRVMNIRPDGRPKKQRKKDDCGCEEKSLAKTPAPKKDRVIGSKKNRVGSAGSISSAGSIGMDETTVRTLSSKVREHNASVKKNNKSDWSKTNLRALKAVYRRGAGAFSVSHRPGMTRNQWAMGRVNAFLSLLMTGKAKSSYITDNDLLPKGHPWKKTGLGSKSLFIDDSEYFAEPIYSTSTGRNNGIGKTTRYIVISMPEDSQEKLQ
jgi:hypothetical protein